MARVCAKGSASGKTRLVFRDNMSCTSTGQSKTSTRTSSIPCPQTNLATCTYTTGLRPCEDNILMCLASPYGSKCSLSHKRYVAKSCVQLSANLSRPAPPNNWCHVHKTTKDKGRKLAPNFSQHYQWPFVFQPSSELDSMSIWNVTPT